MGQNKCNPSVSICCDEWSIPTLQVRERMRIMGGGGVMVLNPEESKKDTVIIGCHGNVVMMLSSFLDRTLPWP